MNNDLEIFQMRSKVKDVAQVLKVMAHPERLLLLCQISQGKLSVTELEQRLGMGQSQISQTLQKLEQLQLVSYERDGKLKYYQLKDEKLKRHIEKLYEIYCKEDL